MSEFDASQLEVAAHQPEDAATGGTSVSSDMMETEAQSVQIAPQAPSSVSDQANDESESVCQNPTTKAEVIACLKENLEKDEPVDRVVLDRLRNTFYRLHNEEIVTAREAFVNGGGLPEDFHPEVDPDEAEYKRLVAEIKEQRAQRAAALDAERKQNLEKKNIIIAKIKAMVANADAVDKNYDDFKALQSEWKEIGQIPAEQVTDTWKNYHHYVEQFYDLLRINHEMRAYDFKKNLEIKTQLCEAAEKLTEETDVINAFHQLQELHQKFRETGPVAKEHREEIWERFKTASTAINKRHQDHFIALKQEEEANLTKKTQLCEQVENLKFENLTTIAEWEAMAQLIKEMQSQWKTIGFTPKKLNQTIFERFRTACDRFFSAKALFLKGLRKTWNENLAKKTELCEKAEALQNSTDWGTTTNALITLQNDWKKVGPVAHKVSDVVWKRFNAACNTFFNRKKEALAGQNEEEQANLEKKQELLKRVEALAEQGSEHLHDDIKALQAEWNAVGHVPFRAKDKINGAYRRACDKIYESLHRAIGQRRVENIVRRASQGSSGSERQYLQRACDEKRSEIKTYETNLGFLNSKSKAGNSLVTDIERRIEHLKAELDLLEEKLAQVKE